MSGDGTVKKKITTRDMLLECLKWMEYKKLFYAADPEGLIPMEGMDKELTEYKKMLNLDENSRILCISTEGDTDKENYQNVVWGGKYSKFDE